MKIRVCVMAWIWVAVWLGVAGGSVAYADSGVVPNGGMEMVYGSSLFWEEPSAGASVAYLPGYAREGTRCLKLNLQYGGAQYWNHAVFAVQPGGDYRFTGAYRIAQSLGEDSLLVRIRWFGQHWRKFETLVSEQDILSGVGSAALDQWVTFSADLTAPAGAIGADLYIGGSSAASTGIAFFDDFKMDKITGAHSATVYMIHEGYVHQGSGKYWSASCDLINSLAGLLAQGGGGEYIFLYSAPTYDEASYRWGMGLGSFYDIKLDFSYDHPDRYWDLINDLKGKLPSQQFIRFSYDTANSCRWAMSLAGLEGCLAVEDSLAADAISNAGLSERESVATGWTEAQVWDRFKADPAANRDLLLENVTAYPSDYRYYLNDLAVAERAWIYYDPDGGEPRATYADWMNDNAAFLGVAWGDEGERIADFSKRGVRTIPADWSWNLATQSRCAQLTPRSPLRNRPLTMRDLAWEDDVSYCCFVMTDGDNLQVLQGTYSTNTQWYGSTRRAAVPMGWQIPPSMRRYASVIDALLTDPVSPMQITDEDCLLTGVSGDGVFFLGPDSDSSRVLGAATASGTALIADHAAGLSEWMKTSAVNVVCTFVYSRTQWLAYDFANFAGQLERPLGLLADTYSGSYADGRGELKWALDKDGFEIPVKATDYSLWDSTDARALDAASLAAQINAASHSGAPVAGSFVRVATHAWSWINSPDQGIMEEVYNTRQQLSSYVRAVRPDEFLMQMRLRLRTAQELGRYKTHLEAKTSELTGSYAPSAQASGVLGQAQATLSQGWALKDSDPAQAFALLQQADAQTEQARLSFMQVELEDGGLAMTCPAPASPLYFYDLCETDPQALTVAGYQIQIAQDPLFANLLLDTFVQEGQYQIEESITDGWVRVRAQGRAHGDWGVWSPVFTYHKDGVSTQLSSMTLE